MCAGHDAAVTQRRWYRDPALPLPRTEVTRFPHGVLEVKLSLPEGQKAPEWVADLLDSGYLTEVSPLGGLSLVLSAENHPVSVGHVDRQSPAHTEVAQLAAMVRKGTLAG